MSRYQAELTDTFGGEANYSWVKRVEFTPTTETPRGILQAARRAVGLTRVPGESYDYGDTYEFRPYGLCQVMFVTLVPEVAL